jgi:nucleotide-binding universal stress UspA family protein
MDQVTTRFRESAAEQEADLAAPRPREQRLIGKSSTTPARSFIKDPEWLIRRILVPTNFSNASAKAIQRAVAMANQCDAALTILHVIDINPPDGPGSAEDLMKRLWTEGSTQMAQLACTLVGQVEAQTMLAEGLPSEVIIEQSSGFDLLVIAKNQDQKGWRPFSKHTARRVVENAACPVMVVHGKPEFGDRTGWSAPPF